MSVFVLEIEIGTILFRNVLREERLLFVPTLAVRESATSESSLQALMTPRDAAEVL